MTIAFKCDPSANEDEDSTRRSARETDGAIFFHFLLSAFVRERERLATCHVRVCVYKNIRRYQGTRTYRRRFFFFSFLPRSARIRSDNGCRFSGTGDRLAETVR